MKLLLAITFSLFGFLVANVQAGEEIIISHAWARATAPGQEVGAAFLTIQSQKNTALIKAESPSAGGVEIHSTTMKNGIMQMRKLDSLPLTANKPTALEPGGYHLMLLGLKKTLKTGDEIQLTLHFKNADGKVSVLHQRVPVKSGENQH
jgi:copper(I)-binding protein